MHASWRARNTVTSHIRNELCHIFARVVSHICTVHIYISIHIYTMRTTCATHMNTAHTHHTHKYITHMNASWRAKSVGASKSDGVAPHVLHSPVHLYNRSQFGVEKNSLNTGNNPTSHRHVVLCKRDPYIWKEPYIYALYTYEKRPKIIHENSPIYIRQQPYIHKQKDLYRPIHMKRAPCL